MNKRTILNKIPSFSKELNELPLGSLLEEKFLLCVKEVGIFLFIMEL